MYCFIWFYNLNVKNALIKDINRYIKAFRNVWSLCVNITKNFKNLHKDGVSSSRTSFDLFYIN